MTKVPIKIKLLKKLATKSYFGCEYQQVVRNFLAVYAVDIMDIINRKDK